MYAIIGANGFLGQYLIKNILEITTEDIIATDIILPEETHEDRIIWQKCDVSNIDDVVDLSKNIKNAKIIYLPAYFNVNKNPENNKIAWDINVISIANFLNILESPKAFYAISTDMLFDTDRDIPYTEFDSISPMNDYARHKAILERMVEAKGYNIVRLPVMMGKSLNNRKKHFYDDIVKTLRTGSSMDFFEDSWRSMLDFNTAAKTIVRLIESAAAKKYPIINIAGDEALSKYDFALRLAEKYGLDKSLVVPIKMDNDTKIWKEKRPKKVLLDNSLVKKVLNLSELKIEI